MRGPATPTRPGVSNDRKDGRWPLPLTCFSNLLRQNQIKTTFTCRSSVLRHNQQQQLCKCHGSSEPGNGKGERGVAAVRGISSADNLGAERIRCGSISPPETNWPTFQGRLLGNSLFLAAAFNLRVLQQRGGGCARASSSSSRNQNPSTFHGGVEQHLHDPSDPCTDKHAHPMCVFSLPLPPFKANQNQP